MLFGYYMETHMGKSAGRARPVDVLHAGRLEQPRNMIGSLSTMARQKGSIMQDTPGAYRLSDRSRLMVIARFAPEQSSDLGVRRGQAEQVESVRSDARESTRGRPRSTPRNTSA